MCPTKARRDDVRWMTTCIMEQIMLEFGPVLIAVLLEWSQRLSLVVYHYASSPQRWDITSKQTVEWKPLH